YSRALVRIYQGDGAAALAGLDDALPHIRRLILHRLSWVWCEINTLIGRAALLLSDSRAARRRARRAIAEVARGDMDYTRGMARLLRAGLCHRDGDAQAAERELVRARRDFEAVSARHLVAACDARIGELVGGAEGAALIERG